MPFSTNSLPLTRRFLSAGAAGLCLLVLAVVACGPDYDPEEVETASNRLNELYDLRYFERGMHEGERWQGAGPTGFEPRAWWVAHRARFTFMPSWVDEAIGEAEAMVEEDEQNGWAWFALAAALDRHQERGEEALDASRRAMELAPSLTEDRRDHLVFLRLRIDVLRHQEEDSIAVDFIEDLPEDIRGDPRIQERKALALVNTSRDLDDVQLRERGYDLWAQVRETAPELVDAWYLPGRYHVQRRRVDRAYPLLKRAAELSPAADPHRYYWRAVQGRDDLSPEQKHAEIEQDIQGFLDGNGDLPMAKFRVWNTYRDLELEGKARELGEEILARHPGSGAAEWVLVNRYRELAEELHGQRQEMGEVDPEIRAEYRGRLVDFIGRDHHESPRLKGDAYRELFRLMQEEVKDDPSAVDPDSLWQVVQGMVELEGINLHVTHRNGPIALAERGVRFREAERIAREGLEKAQQEVDEDREAGFIETAEEYDERLTRYQGIFHDAIGWIYFHEGCLDEAERELLLAYDLHREDRKTLNHLGRFYEYRYARAAGIEPPPDASPSAPESREEASTAGGSSPAADADGASDAAQESGIPGAPAGARAAVAVTEPLDADEPEDYLDRAEDFYIKGVMVQGPRENPNEEDLKDLYVQKNGSETGWESYRTRVAEIDRERRREEILANRIEDPERAEPFELATLRGEGESTLSFEELGGRVVVINFWGVWCAPCVQEMPEFQEFSEKYRDDEAVAVLTINNDPNPDQVRDWMAEKGYDFRVLLDDGYVGDEAGVTAFPTTWFIDPEGRVAFEKRGWSDDLTQEFSWRVEALKGSASQE